VNTRKLTPLTLTFRRPAWMGWVGLGLMLGVTSALGNTATRPGEGSVTNMIGGVIEIPRAHFVNPRSPAEGKDPFFPRSMRPYSAAAVPQPVVTNTTPVVVVADLKLNGISGTTERRLAIINNHTFEAGEEAVLSTSTGKFVVRCIEIRADGVSVMVSGERRELRLRSGI
jgi:hypothetical protein